MPGAETISEREAEALLAPLMGHQRVCLAVSGGSDSMALLRLAARWARGAGTGVELIVASVDHGLRPEAGEEARWVIGKARQLGLNGEVLTLHHEDCTPVSQAKARRHRYRLISDFAVRGKCTAIVTAHTLDDQAETFMMRLARGSGSGGLAGIRPVSRLAGLDLIRPLLTVSRARLQATLEAFGDGWVGDPSNRDERFERVRVRSLLDRLEEAGIDRGNIALSVRRLARADEALEAMRQSMEGEIVTPHESGFCEIDRDGYGRGEREVRLRLLDTLLRRYGGGFDYMRLEAIERLDEWLLTGAGSGRTLAGCQIARRPGRVLMCRDVGRMESGPQRMTAGKMLWDNRFVICRRGDDDGIVIIKAMAQAGWRGQRPDDVPACAWRSMPVAARGNGKARLLAPFAQLAGSEPAPGLKARFVGGDGYGRGMASRRQRVGIDVR